MCGKLYNAKGYSIFWHFRHLSIWQFLSFKFFALLSTRQLRRRQWHPTPVLLPGKSCGRRSLVGCSPWGRSSRTRLRNFTFTFHFHALEKEMATHSSVLAWRIPGTWKPGWLPSMAHLLHRVGHDWSDLAAAGQLRVLWCFLQGDASMKQQLEITWVKGYFRLLNKIPFC